MGTDVEVVKVSEPGFVGGIVDKLKGYWLNFVVRSLFERIPLLKTIFGKMDGYKTFIGRIGVALSIILYMLSYQFPEIPHISETYAVYMMIMSWVFEQLGIQHRVDKEQREKLFTDEFSGV